MRIKDGFVIREVAGQIMVIATGEASKDFHGMIKINNTGRDIWTGLTDGLSEEEIIERIKEKYQVEPERAESDVREFISNMRDMGFVVDE